ncbi:DUF2793 domain-containing protein [Puniceibacterium sediminis]|uniref:DUF2793 domain-containing protein n=1 Tax=Puniceibacterium sediminis TaxID=1608407 RepID=A0A238YMX7_9RHOB|nr:DUF2793 domain-containing protein [Puniceibacterium sediminis]SNR72390.1 Protein of unknown function [Puniceibacterium sediminis]
MPDNSIRLSLPFLLPSQAQKHVTHNSALEVLDVLVQLRLHGLDLVTPPGSPQDGAVFAIGTGATGSWAGQDGQLAAWDNGGWLFVTPQVGWQAVLLPAGWIYTYTGSGWALSQGATQNLDGIGIGTESDSINRLTVAGDASLFSHVGGGHQIKINKAAAGSTASLLFQSDWIGHAEMGLVGDTDWGLKVSPDGSAWTTALQVSSTSGHVTGAAVQTDPADVTPGRLMRADYGYGPGNLVGAVSQLAGQPTGAVVERGENANGTYMRLACGTQICWISGFGAYATSIAHGALFRSENQNWYYPATFAAPPSVICSAEGSSRWGTVGSRSAISCGSQIYAPTQSITAGTADLLAIGLWF